MAFWLEIAAFALKALVIAASIGGLIALIAFLTRGQGEEASHIKIDSLNARYDRARARINAEILVKKERKALAKATKKAAKAEFTAPAKRRVYVLDFKGDIRASAVKRLGAEIDAVLTVARAGQDEVVVRIDSAGGAVTGYGLGAAQLARLRAASLKVTVCVDQVAASGGYLMACVADRIVAAPFALLGSIGVVAQVPNVNRLLKKNAIDFEELTAGEHKRSVSIFGEITPAGRDHFRAKLDSTHQAFKAFVKRNRPGLDIDKVGDGDVWLASEALECGLIDALSTSDDLLFGLRAEAKLFALSLSERKSPLRMVLDRFALAARSLFDFAYRLAASAR